MAGWWMIADENCSLDCLRASQKKRTCTVDAVPPMLGDGKPVDLIKLYLVVREKGGYDAVSDNGLWGMVAEECGLALDLSPFVKLVYVKYLDTIEKGIEGIEVKDSIANVSGRNSVLRKVAVELAAELKELLEIHKWTAMNMSTDKDINGSEKLHVDDAESVHMGTASSAIGNAEVEKLSSSLPKSTAVDSSSGGHKNPKGSEKNVDSILKDAKMSNEGKSVTADMDKSKECVNDDVTDDANIDSVETSARKRKWESISRLLNWVTGVARGPCDNVFDPLPECSKWKSHGNQEAWKQVLLVREALFLKINVESGAEQSTPKKNRKMHPSMYDDPIGSAYNFRERLKVDKKLLHLGKTSSKAQALSNSQSSSSNNSGSNRKGIAENDPSVEESLLDLPAENVIPVGPDFQGELPEWKGAVSQSDSKWLGARSWPPEKVDNRFIVEREPIGKGRQDSCGCAVPKSVECVRFHLAERRLRVKRELGMAFYHWEFDKMGEEVKLGWQPEEEKKFKAIVQSNPASLDKCFWDEIVKHFKTKKRDELVSYYFNVFLLLKRAHQNRATPNNTDSDDDAESKSGGGLVSPGSKREAPKSLGSLLCSAKKSRKNAK